MDPSGSLYLLAPPSPLVGEVEVEVDGGRHASPFAIAGRRTKVPGTWRWPPRTTKDDPQDQDGGAQKKSQENGRFIHEKRVWWGRCGKTPVKPVRCCCACWRLLRSFPLSASGLPNPQTTPLPLLFPRSPGPAARGGHPPAPTLLRRHALLQTSRDTRLPTKQGPNP